MDHYQVLGLDRTATKKQIRTAFRKLSLKYHPDKSNKPRAAEIFDKINDAYTVLSDEDQRRIYDDFGEEKFQTKWQYEEARRKGQVRQMNDFYAGSDLVESFDRPKFFAAERKVKQGRQRGLMIEFYAPWCSHCQDMISDYKKFAIIAENLPPSKKNPNMLPIQFAAVNCEDKKRLCRNLNINSYPTLILYHGEELEVYRGDHSADAMYSWMESLYSEEVEELNDSNFEQRVYRDVDEDVQYPGLWLIDFSAGSWCGPCTNVKSTVRKYAGLLKGVAKVGIINCDNSNICGQLNVGYFPQMRLFWRLDPKFDGSELPGSGGLYDDYDAPEAPTPPQEGIHIELGRGNSDITSILQVSTELLKIMPYQRTQTPKKPREEDEEDYGWGADDDEERDEL